MASEKNDECENTTREFKFGKRLTGRPLEGVWERETERERERGREER